ncbi:MAG: hypothetical protein ACQGQP_00540 [Desulfovibrio sp.]|jgi:hypothetical protein
MAYDIRLVKIVTGEMVIGKFNAEANALDDVAIIQTIPTQQGVQIMILPYGYPFDQDFSGSIGGQHFLFEYSHTPQDIQDKYLEAASNLSLSSGGLDPTPPNGGSGLIL